MLNTGDNSLWFIEAVTSDEEVDEHKMLGLKKICEQSGKIFGGATTTYLSWKEMAVRRHKYKNLANGSCVWIREDPGRYLIIKEQ